MTFGQISLQVHSNIKRTYEEFYSFGNGKTGGLTGGQLRDGEKMVKGSAMNDALPPDLGRRVGDLDSLPAELRAQLQVGKLSDIEREIISLIRDDLDGVANVDEILVGLFRRTNQVHERQPLANRLYRMGQSGHLISVPKKKGVYRVK